MRQGIMLCYPLEEKRLMKWSSFLCQPKLDGDRCRAVPTSNGYKLLTSEENEVTSCWHLLEQLNEIPPELRMELDGELYNHNLPHNELHGIVSRHHPSALSTSVEYHVFDLIIENCRQSDRLIKILDILPFFGHDIKFVETYLIDTLSDVMKFFNKFIEKGFEGIIVRNSEGYYKRKRSTDIMKFKPTKSDWYEVIGWKEEADKNGNGKNSLGSLLCRGDDGTIFSVGSGLTREQRISWWKDQDSLIGKMVKVQYQRQNKGTPIFPVFLELV